MNHSNWSYKRTNWTPIYTQHGINESGPSVANPTYHQAMRQIVAQRPQRPQLRAATVATRGASQQQCLGKFGDFMGPFFGGGLIIKWEFCDSGPYHGYQT